MSNAERLEARFREMKANGLTDLKIFFDPLKAGVTVEDLCSDLNKALDAVDAGDYVPLEMPADSVRAARA